MTRISEQYYLVAAIILCSFCFTAEAWSAELFLSKETALQKTVSQKIIVKPKSQRELADEKAATIYKKLRSVDTWIEISRTKNGRTATDYIKSNLFEWMFTMSEKGKVSMWLRGGELSPVHWYYRIDAFYSPIRFDRIHVEPGKPFSTLSFVPGIIKFEGDKIFIACGQHEKNNPLGQYKTRPSNFVGKGTTTVVELIKKPEEPPSLPRKKKVVQPKSPREIADEKAVAIYKKLRSVDSWIECSRTEYGKVRKETTEFHLYNFSLRKGEVKQWYQHAKGGSYSCYRIDASYSPVRFDFYSTNGKYSTKIVPGIIKFEKNRLVIAMGKGEIYSSTGQYKTRPTDFSEKNTPRISVFIAQPKELVIPPKSSKYECLFNHFLYSRK